MAKPLVFQYRDRQISFDMTKVERAKLYGFKDTEVVDEEGKPCQLATLAQDGHTLISSGGAALGTLSPDGKWVEKSTLNPVDVSGKTIVPVPSSFASPIPLVEEATIEDYLDCAIRAIYVMQSSESLEELGEELKNGKIFRFPYSFRGGLEPDQGFLLSNFEGKIFCAIGKPIKNEFLGLQQTAAAVMEEEAVVEEEESDPMDFGMM